MSRGTKAPAEHPGAESPGSKNPGKHPEAASIKVPVTMQLKVDDLPLGVAGKRKAEEALGPSGLLVDLFTIYPPSHSRVAPLGPGEDGRAGPQGVLKRLKLAW